MLKFKAVAEHTAGQSVAHPCLKGVFADPSDDWRADVEAETLAAAEERAAASLGEFVGNNPPVCDCDRHQQAGNAAWWSSVSITLWPQNCDALAALMENGADPRWLSRDPYRLLPAEIAAQLAAMDVA